jgi:hypothetical protein
MVDEGYIAFVRCKMNLRGPKCTRKVDGLRGVSESSRIVIVVPVSVKEYERGGQGHTSASLLHQSGR